MIAVAIVERNLSKALNLQSSMNVARVDVENLQYCMLDYEFLRNTAAGLRTIFLMITCAGVI